MDVKSDYPEKFVVDHSFTFVGGGGFNITTDVDEVFEEDDAQWSFSLSDKTAKKAQRTVIYKAHVTTYHRVVRTVVDYPEGHSPAELAIKEIDERNKRRIAARQPLREGAD